MRKENSFSDISNWEFHIFYLVIHGCYLSTREILNSTYLYNIEITCLIWDKELGLSGSKKIKTQSWILSITSTQSLFPKNHKIHVIYQIYDSFMYVYSHIYSCVNMGHINLLSWLSQSAKSGIPSSTMDVRRHSYQGVFVRFECLLIYLFFCLIPRQIHSERTTKSPPS